jgi:hypothetical protein
MKRPARVWIAWGLFGLAAAITAAVWGNAVLARPSLAVLAEDDFSLNLVTLASAALGALILARLPRHPIGWLLMIQGVGCALAAPGSDYFRSLSAPPAAPSALFLVLLWFDNWSWLLLIFPLLFVPLYFPTGRLISRRWQGAVALGLGMCLLLMTLAGLGTRLSRTDQAWSVANPIGFIPDYWDRAILPPWGLGLITLTLLSLGSVIVRYRGGSAVERQQIKWLLVGCLVFAAVYVALVAVPAMRGDTAVGTLWNLLFAPSLLAIPGAITMAILRQRLWDIDVLIRRTLIYSVLTGVLALVYLGTVLVLQNVLAALTGESRSELVTVLSTLAIAALFGPLRARVQAAIDRRFYRRKYDAAQTLAGFAASARDETDLETLSGRLVGVVGETMQPRSVGLWLRPATGAQPAQAAAHRR